MTPRITLLSSALLACAITPAAFSRGDGACSTACPTKTTEAAVTNAAFTAVAPEEANAPQMACFVDGKMYSCVMKAVKASSESGKPASYIVSGVRYDDPVDATRNFERRLRSAIMDATTVRIAAGNQCVECPAEASRIAGETGQPVRFRVGNTYFNCDQAARQAAARALAAVESVHMTYKVGDQSFDCAESARQAAQASSAHVTYVVANQSCPCDILASCMLAKAQLAAATAAITADGGHG